MRFQLFKLVLAIVALTFGAYKGLQGLDVALHESEPTSLTAGDFATTYRGQQHLRVHGRVATEHLALRPGSRGDGGRVRVLAAVVPDDWTPEQPVHVVGAFGSRSPDDVAGWTADAQRLTAVEGLVGNHPKISEALAPLEVAENAVVVNHGTAPQLGPMLFFLGLMLLGMFLGVGTLRNIMRERDR